VLHFFFVGYFIKLSVSGLYSVEQWDDWQIENNLESTGHGLIKLLFWNLYGGTEENYENPQMG
jgi:hypothetical protein